MLRGVKVRGAAPVSSPQLKRIKARDARAVPRREDCRNRARPRGGERAGGGGRAGGGRIGILIELLRMFSCSGMLLITACCVPDECCGVLVVELHAEDVEYEGAVLNAEVQWLIGERRERGRGHLQRDFGEPTRRVWRTYKTKLANLQDEVGEPTRPSWRTYKTKLANLQDEVGEPT